MQASAPGLALADWSAPELCKPECASSPVDARGADWRGLKLGALNLSEANLCRVDLRGADLRQANLQGCDLRLARYDNTTLFPDGFDARSSGAVGPGARLSGVFLNCTDLRGMDLRGLP